jgi:hypothetical protein
MKQFEGGCVTRTLAGTGDRVLTCRANQSNDRYPSLGCGDARAYSQSGGGAPVRANGSFVRIATNAPVGSTEDAFVKVACARTPEDMQTSSATKGEMRVGTLLFDRDGVPVSVLHCLTPEGYAFDPETGLIAKPGEVPHPLFWFGALPRPEDYILRRSQDTLEGILTDSEGEGSRSQLIAGRLRQTMAMRVN